MRLVRRQFGIHIAAVVPAYNVGPWVVAVLREIPEQVRTVIVVDDGSSDDTAAVVAAHAETDERVHLLRHPSNRGVGAAMVSGYEAALHLGADIIVKIDGDGQMPLAMLPRLIQPLIDGEADYTKGNRFRDFQAIRKMPPLRRLGNIGLSFLAKAATGYWHAFDPTNGFVAIRADVLAQVPLSELSPGYFFETSMLGRLYLLGAVVKDIPMPARYAGEPSSLSIPRVLAGFPGRLIAAFFRRLFLKNLVYDFSLESLHLVSSSVLLTAGTIYGGYQWAWHATRGVAAPTGTVVLSALLVILGFQSMLAAITLDLQATPREPINDGPIVGEVVEAQPVTLLQRKNPK